MSLYFFNVHDGRDITDDVGSELPDLAAVRREALLTAGELLKEGGAADLWAGEEWMMVVNDDTGAEVLTLRFSGHQHVLEGEMKGHTAEAR